MTELIICEKPKTAEKVAKAISNDSIKKSYKKVPYYELTNKEGQEVRVLSAVGHLYTLKSSNSRKKRLFDVEWTPLYEKDKSKKYVKNYIETIKKFSKDADRYIHACDYDIEGTLIGYNALKYACGKNSINKTLRMKFSTLTKKDLQEAYDKAYPLTNDQSWADSGETRHIMDFLFGVNISKSITDSVLEATQRYVQLSAGRVQTPTLAILSQREEEIRKFIPKTYWLIKAKLEKGLIAEHKKGKIFDKKETEEILKKCKGKPAIIKKIKTRKTKKAQPVPFELGALQSEAFAQFGFTPKKTQQIAQNLYIEGYTSYPRTSSQKLPENLELPKILKQLSKHSQYKEKINQLKEPLKPNEGKKTDEAHPAIHPTGNLPKDLTKDSQKLYDLITYRFISLFGEPAEVESIKLDMDIGSEDFTLSKQRISKLGWLNLDPYQLKKVKNEDFPTLKENDQLKAKVISEEKETKPPARYNQASIIKELEKRGLGTKSTRANIVSILYSRKYVEGKQITVNQLGERMINTLEKYSTKLTSEDMTREFELDLNNIKDKKITEDEVVTEVKTELNSILDSIDENKKNIGEELYAAYKDSRIVGDCDCGGKLIIISSPRGGNFVGCSSYPDCKKTFSLPAGANVLKTTCEKCGLPLISYGKPRQRACLDFKCANGGEQSSNDVVGPCPECGSDLIKRMGRFGEFIGCSGFPKCRFTKSLSDFEKENNEDNQKSTDKKND
ncbi:MAG: DNA topoisomerase I [Methanobacteriaceae archaeon]|nr:DNA topoisomerase I [Methanobacteriaceae archaeon]